MKEKDRVSTKIPQEVGIRGELETEQGEIRS